MTLAQNLAFFGFALIPLWLGLMALAREMTRGNHHKHSPRRMEKTGD